MTGACIKKAAWFGFLILQAVLIELAGAEEARPELVLNYYTGTKEVRLIVGEQRGGGPIYVVKSQEGESLSCGASGYGRKIFRLPKAGRYWLVVKGTGLEIEPMRLDVRQSEERWLTLRGNSTAYLWLQPVHPSLCVYGFTGVPWGDKATAEPYLKSNVTPKTRWQN